MSGSIIQAELLLPDALCTFETVTEFEERLDRRLIASGIGEVMGGGIGSGWYRFDLTLADYDRAVEWLLESALDLELPPGTWLRRKGTQSLTAIVAASKEDSDRN